MYLYVVTIRREFVLLNGRESLFFSRLTRTCGLGTVLCNKHLSRMDVRAPRPVAVPDRVNPDGTLRIEMTTIGVPIARLVTG